MQKAMVLELESITKLHLISIKNQGLSLFEGQSSKQAKKNSQVPLFTAKKCIEDNTFKFNDKLNNQIGFTNKCPKSSSHIIELNISDKCYELKKDKWWSTRRNFLTNTGTPVAIRREVRGYLQIINLNNNHVLATFTYSHWSVNKIGVIRLFSTECITDDDKLLFTVVLILMAKLEKQRQLEIASPFS